jgi:hypothetical protein
MTLPLTPESICCGCCAVGGKSQRRIRRITYEWPPHTDFHENSLTLKDTLIAIAVFHWAHGHNTSPDCFYVTTDVPDDPITGKPPIHKPTYN